MTEEQLQHEIQRNKNRIATKQVNNIDDVKPLDPTKRNQIGCMTAKLYGFLEDHNIADMYTTFQIPKRSGGMREITAPDGELKEMQTALLKLFSKGLRFLPHNAAHGFTKHRNCKTSLEVHRAHKSRWFLKLDIKDFFPNTTSDLLRKSMCSVYPFCHLTDIQKDTIIGICTLNGATPQGAPTSPMLTNMVMVQYDMAISKYCKANDLIYTRYADDILISSRVSFDWETVQNKIQELLGDVYQLKTEKTRYGSFNGRNWNLGLMYNNKCEITVGHKKKQLVKCMVHNYLTKEEEHTYENWYKLLGTVGYCNYIEPQYFSEMLETIKANKPAI